jgi:hypothetical protein
VCEGRGGADAMYLPACKLRSMVGEYYTAEPGVRLPWPPSYTRALPYPTLRRGCFLCLAGFFPWFFYALRAACLGPVQSEQPARASSVLRHHVISEEGFC